MVTVIDIPTPHVLRTPDEYDTVVAEIDRLLDRDPAPFSADSDRLELLSVLVKITRCATIRSMIPTSHPWTSFSSWPNRRG